MSLDIHPFIAPAAATVPGMCTLHLSLFVIRIDVPAASRCPRPLKFSKFLVPPLLSKLFYPANKPKTKQNPLNLTSSYPQIEDLPLGSDLAWLLIIPFEIALRLLRVYQPNSRPVALFILLLLIRTIDPRRGTRIHFSTTLRKSSVLNNQHCPQYQLPTQRLSCHRVSNRLLSAMLPMIW